MLLDNDNVTKTKKLVKGVTTMGRKLDLRSTGRGFKSYSGQSCVKPWASCSHLCASVTKQYNLVPAKGWWCSVAGVDCVCICSL